MTNQNQNTLSTRELDAAIEREVFGRCSHIHRKPDKPIKTTTKTLCRYCETELISYEVPYIKSELLTDYQTYSDTEHNYCPEYATDLNAAFKIVDYLLEQDPDIDCAIKTVYSNRFSGCITDVYFQRKHFDVIAVVEANNQVSLAQAICQAALMVVREKGK